MIWQHDKTLIILCAGIVFFTVVTVGVVALWAGDGQIYTLFAGAFGSFNGALMMHLKGSSERPDSKEEKPKTEEPQS